MLSRLVISPLRRSKTYMHGPVLNRLMGAQADMSGAKKVLVLLPTSAPTLRVSILERLEKAGLVADEHYRVVDVSRDLNEDPSFPDIDIGAIAIAPVTKSHDLLDEILKKHAPNARWVHSLWAGVDGVLSDQLRQRQDIILTNAKHAFSESLGEYAMLGALYFAKRVPTCIDQYRRNHWEKYTLHMLKGATMCIVGYGSIGEQVGMRAKMGFGMRVLAVTRHPRPTPLLHVDEVFTTDALPTVLPRCDYVISILPGTPETKHFWDEVRLRYLHKDSVFMNLGRGTSVDEHALVASLKGGNLRGAVLDVFESEPLPANSPLWTVGEDKLLLTPHCADYVPDYWDSAARICVDNIQRFRQGLPLLNQVNKALGY